MKPVLGDRIWSAILVQLHQLSLGVQEDLVALVKLLCYTALNWSVLDNHRRWLGHEDRVATSVRGTGTTDISGISMIIIGLGVICMCMRNSFRRANKWLSRI